MSTAKDARGRWLAATATVLVVAAIGCGDADTHATDAPPTTPVTTVPTTAVAAEPLPGTEAVAELTWDDGRAALDDAIPGLASRLDEIGLTDAAITLYASDDLPDDQRLDLAAGGRLLVGAALDFDDAAAAEQGRAALQEAAAEFTAGVGVAAMPLEAADLPPGSLGLAVPDGTFPGGAAAVAWVDGDTLLLAFAQGTPAPDDVAALAARLAAARR